MYHAWLGMPMFICSHRWRGARLNVGKQIEQFSKMRLYKFIHFIIYSGDETQTIPIAHAKRCRTPTDRTVAQVSRAFRACSQHSGDYRFGGGADQEGR